MRQGRRRLRARLLRQQVAWMQARRTCGLSGTQARRIRRRVRSWTRPTRKRGKSKSGTGPQARRIRMPNRSAGEVDPHAKPTRSLETPCISRLFELDATLWRECDIDGYSKRRRCRILPLSWQECQNRRFDGCFRSDRIAGLQAHHFHPDLRHSACLKPVLRR